MEPTQYPPSPEKSLEGWPDWSILVVDDEQGMLNFLVKTLAPRCHFVMSAGSAEEGAETAIWLATADISERGTEQVTGLLWEDRKIVPY